jgi:hypothetical protein
VRFATLHDTQRNAHCTYIRTELLWSLPIRLSERFRWRGTGRKHLAASLTPAVLPIDAPRDAHQSLHHRVQGCRAAGAGEARTGGFRHDSPRIHLYSGERRSTLSTRGSQCGLNRSLFVSHVIRLAGLVRCACFEMAECDGCGPARWLSHANRLPDLGNQPLRSQKITECQSIRDARTRDPFPLLAEWAQDVILHFEALQACSAWPLKSLLSSDNLMFMGVETVYM